MDYIDYNDDDIIFNDETCEKLYKKGYVYAVLCKYRMEEKTYYTCGSSSKSLEMVDMKWRIFSKKKDAETYCEFVSMTYPKARMEDLTPSRYKYYRQTQEKIEELQETCKETNEEDSQENSQENRKIDLNSFLEKLRSNFGGSWSFTPDENFDGAC